MIKLLLTFAFFFVTFFSMAQHRSLSESEKSFSIDLYKKMIQEKQNNSKNLFFSPLSIHLALSMLREGTKGDSQRELANALKTDSLKNLPLPYNQYLTNFDYKIDESQFSFEESTKENKNPSGFRFGIHNAIWLDKDFPIKNNYRQKVENEYRSQINNLDFINKPQTAEKINNWIKEKTNNQIKEIIDTIYADSTKMILTNTVDFEAE